MNQTTTKHSVVVAQFIGLFDAILIALDKSGNYGIFVLV
jgi:hypothetical protein